MKDLYIPDHGYVEEIIANAFIHDMWRTSKQMNKLWQIFIAVGQIPAEYLNSIPMDIRPAIGEYTDTAFSSVFRRIDDFRSHFRIPQKIELSQKSIEQQDKYLYDFFLVHKIETKLVQDYILDILSLCNIRDKTHIKHNGSNSHEEHVSDLVTPEVDRLFIRLSDRFFSSIEAMKEKK